VNARTELQYENTQLRKRVRAACLSESAKPYRCRDCGERAHPYMVNNRLWVAVGMTFVTGVYLCLPCLSKRCGRDLTRRDFPDWQPQNYWLRWRRGKLVLKSSEAAWVAMRKAQHGKRWLVLDWKTITDDGHVMDLRKLDAFEAEALKLHRKLSAQVATP
jgi:hypothetical protein